MAEDLDSELSTIRVEPFDLVLQGVGAFGEGPDIRALWAGVAENPALNRLAARCETAAKRAGLKPDPRAHRPHVTLAYLKRPEPTKVAAWIQANNLLKSDPVRITWFGLYSSWRSAEASRYDLEREYPLF
jgi:2'-5' RNA ligase